MVWASVTFASDSTTVGAGHNATSRTPTRTVWAGAAGHRRRARSGESAGRTVVGRSEGPPGASEGAGAHVEAMVEEARAVNDGRLVTAHTVRGQRPTAPPRYHFSSTLPRCSTSTWSGRT